MTCGRMTVLGTLPSTGYFVCGVLLSHADVSNVHDSGSFKRLATFASGAKFGVEQKPVHVTVAASRGSPAVLQQLRTPPP
jgi:hypothetical protein